MATSAAAQRDPFHQFRQKLAESVGKTSAAFEKWKYVLENQNTAASDEFNALTRTIQVDLKSINVDVSNLNKVINAIEANRAKFPNIDDAELGARRVAVNELASKARTMEEFMTSARSKKKMERDQRSDLLTTAGSSGSARGGGLGGDDGRRYAKGAETVQQRRAAAAAREAEQSEVLTDMSAAMDRLHGTSTQIQGKLQTQTVLLDEMTENTEVMEGLMATTLRKMDVLLEKSKSGRICCLIMLFAIAITLFFLIIYL